MEVYRIQYTGLFRNEAGVCIVLAESKEEAEHMFFANPGTPKHEKENKILSIEWLCDARHRRVVYNDDGNY